MSLIVITGAGGFIGGHLVRHFSQNGEHSVRAVDKKPHHEWHQLISPQSVCLDLSIEENCHKICEDADEVYNLAADMGGMGFIEVHRVECMRSVLINTHMLQAAHLAKVKRYFFSSSACVYNSNLQRNTDVTALKEFDAYPAMAERGYGWEKLFSEMMCQEYYAELGLKTFIARFHNVYGPHGSWDGGREKAPAAICRKVLDAIGTSAKQILIWGDGKQTRSFMYIDDCIEGIDKIMHQESLVATPVNLGSSELVSINDLVSEVELIAGVKLDRVYDHFAPRGVAGRNSDNTFIKNALKWEPTITLQSGLVPTYDWIKGQYESLGNRAWNT